MINHFNRILILAPHTDDGELGCGGSAVKFLSEGREVFYVAFASEQKKSDGKFPKNILELEMHEAAKVLGIDPKNVRAFKYPIRYFCDHRQEILEEMVKLREEIKPDLIFMPSLNDIHQDHQVIAQEGLRAFKRQAILGYEEPWNNLVFETRCFITLNKEQVEKKVEALNCYKSQHHRPYLKDDFIWSLAHARGVQIEGEYAEAFEVLRLVFTK